MTSPAPVLDFDVQAAWLRRFTSDAEGNLRAFALLVKEGLPGKVDVHEKKAFLSRNTTTTGVSILLGDHRYDLSLEEGALHTRIAMVVRNITLNTRQVEPAEWFSRLFHDIQSASDRARQLSQSLAAFLSGGG